MSDNLVARLRGKDQLGDADYDYDDLLRDAADRIEALVDALQRFNRSYDEMCTHHEQRIEALEAALRQIAEDPVVASTHAKGIARRALEGK